MTLSPTATLTGREWTWLLASYFIGCFTAGYYWVRWRTGHDLREQGSGNLGARNAGRTLGPSAFAVTLLLDAAKGALVVGLARYFGLGSVAILASLVAVVIGHNWPMQLRFHGGKGIAVSFGALLAYDPFIVLCLLMVFAPLMVLLRNFTLSGLFAFALGPLTLFLGGADNEKIVAMSILAVMVLITHRKNIREEFARFFPARPVRPAPNPMHQSTDEGPHDER